MRDDALSVCLLVYGLWSKHPLGWIENFMVKCLTAICALGTKHSMSNQQNMIVMRKCSAFWHLVQKVQEPGSRATVIS